MEVISSGHLLPRPRTWESISVPTRDGCPGLFVGEGSADSTEPEVESGPQILVLVLYNFPKTEKKMQLFVSEDGRERVWWRSWKG